MKKDKKKDNIDKRLEFMMFTFKEDYKCNAKKPMTSDENITRIRDIFMKCELEQIVNRKLVTTLVPKHSDPKVVYYVIPYLYTFKDDNLYKSNFDKDFAKYNDEIVELFGKLNLEKIRLYNFTMYSKKVLYRDVAISDGKAIISDFVEIDRHEDEDADRISLVITYMILENSLPDPGEPTPLNKIKQKYMVPYNIHVVDEYLSKFIGELNDKPEDDGDPTSSENVLLQIDIGINVIVDIKNVDDRANIYSKISDNVYEINTIINNNLLFDNLPINKSGEKDLVIHNSKDLIEFNFIDPLYNGNYTQDAFSKADIFTKVLVNFGFNKINDNIKNKIVSEVEELLGVKGLVINVVGLRKYLMIKDLIAYTKTLSNIPKGINREFMAYVPIPHACFTTAEYLDISQLDGLYIDDLNTRKKMRLYTR